MDGGKDDTMRQNRMTGNAELPIANSRLPIEHQRRAPGGMDILSEGAPVLPSNWQLTIENRQSRPGLAHRLAAVLVLLTIAVAPS